MLLRILIADDEPIERKVLRKIIHDSQLPAIVVHMAKSGNDVLEHVEKLIPDLILMDIRMPGMNGLELSSLIKAKYPDTIIAIVTAYDEFQYAKRAIDLHIDYFLLKPVEYAEVERIIKETIDKKLDQPQEIGPATISPHRMQIAQQIVSLIHRHYTEPITLVWLEEQMNISHQYLSRTFRDAYRMTIMNYLMQFRIKLALKLLGIPELSVAMVAEKVGIPDASYFGQLFKQSQNVTPTQYRNQLLQKTASEQANQLLHQLPDDF